jgi:hypothetical protein
MINLIHIDMFQKQNGKRGSDTNTPRKMKKKPGYVTIMKKHLITAMFDMTSNNRINKITAYREFISCFSLRCLYQLVECG